MDELADLGDHHAGVQLLYLHKDIIDLQLQLTTNNQNGKESVRTGTIKGLINESYYQIKLPKRK